MARPLCPPSCNSETARTLTFRAKALETRDVSSSWKRHLGDGSAKGARPT